MAVDKSLIGTPTGRSKITVERGPVSNFAKALQDENPIYQSPEAAKQAGDDDQERDREPVAFRRLVPVPLIGWRSRSCGWLLVGGCGHTRGPRLRESARAPLRPHREPMGGVPAL